MDATEDEDMLRVRDKAMEIGPQTLVLRFPRGESSQSYMQVKVRVRLEASEAKSQ